VIFLICVDKAAEIYAGYVGVLLINQNYINVIKKDGTRDWRTDMQSPTFQALGAVY